MSGPEGFGSITQTLTEPIEPEVFKRIGDEAFDYADSCTLRGVPDVVDDCLQSTSPAIALASRVIKSELVSMVDESDQTKADANMQATVEGEAGETGCLVSALALSSVIEMRQLEPWAIVVHLPAAKAEVKDQQLDLIEDVGAKYPALGVIAKYLEQKSTDYVGINTDTDSPDNAIEMTPAQKDKKESFLSAAQTLYLAAAKAHEQSLKIGSSDSLPDTPEALPNLDFYSACQKYDRLGINEIKAVEGAAKYFAGASPKHAFPKVPVFGTIFEQLKDANALKVFSRQVDSKGEEIKPNDSGVHRKMRQSFNEGCFGALNALYNSAKPQIKKALKSIDEVIIEDTIEVAYERADAIAWLEANPASDEALIDKYPLLKAVRQLMAKKQAGLRDPDQLNGIYEGYMSVCLTLAWYLEQASVDGEYQAAKTKVITPSRKEFAALMSQWIQA